MKRKSEIRHAQVWPLNGIRPAPENDEIYRPISVDHVRDLIADIREHGMLEPILVSADGYIISGHRRYFVARLIGFAEVPVRFHSVSRERNYEKFLRLLVGANAQRIKDAEVLLAEAVTKVDPVAAHAKIVAERKAKEQIRKENCTLSEVTSSDDGRRPKLTKAKQPMLDAILRIIEEQCDHWPLTVRQLHYRLLGPDAPLKHASKPDSRYVNDCKSYQAVIDVVGRGRVEGFIPWAAIDDDTRAVDENRAFYNLGEFFQQETDNFLQGYWRNLLQSQPRHFEIVTEKRTLHRILAQVARAHTMPLTIMGGMNTLTPKKKIFDRYRRSRKEKLIILAINDLDPAGDTIAKDLLKSFRRDFGIRDIEVYKVVLTIEQVREFDLAPSMDAKENSSNYREYVERYGTTDAWELEALAPGDLVDVLTDAIDELVDIELFNQEVDAEQADSAKLVAIQEQCAAFFKSLRIA